MSLVHDALQKADREKQRKTGFPPRPAAPVVTPSTGATVAVLPKPAPAPSLNTSQKSPPSVMLMTAIVCVAIVATATIVYFVSRTTPATRTVVAKPATVEPKPATAPSAPAQPPVAVATDNPPSPTAPTSASAFRLSGIVKDPEGLYCAMLNGRIVRENDIVDGATVKRIERDAVTLEVNGSEKILPLN